MAVALTHTKKFASPQPGLKPEQQEDDSTAPMLFATVVGECVDVERKEGRSPIRQFMPRPSTVEPPALNQ
eukprot:6160560-Amphidinium_carterae.2